MERTLIWGPLNIGADLRPKESVGPDTGFKKMFSPFEKKKNKGVGAGWNK